MATRANEWARRIHEEHQVPPLSDAAEADIVDVLRRRAMMAEMVRSGRI